jgi:hypothetical protein
MKNINIVYQQFTLEAVMQYFMDGLRPPDGKIIISSDFFVDVSKNIVIIKLYVEQADAEAIECGGD